MCGADSALALQRAQCPHQKILVGKSLDGEEDFLVSDVGKLLPVLAKTCVLLQGDSLRSKTG